MGIIEEFKISIFMPQHYHKLKGESIVKLLRFDFVLTILGVLYLTLIKLILSLFTGNFHTFLDYYSQLSFKNIVSSLLFLYIGLIASSIVLSIIFYIVATLKKTKDLGFYDLIVYATHALTICIILEEFFGPLVIVLSIGYFLISISGEKLIANYVFNKTKGGRKNGKRV
ncbi:MAG: hypothetical protein PWR08_2025 [Thermoanaerobacterium sp.]|uniref:hypothetical protein n=1 Tax=Thermoanaerobacterium thermosaccharolyticum TaxID=1517 RepID=UPI00264FC85F|nr:hypothetical protein [Thermoanaerobacterium sp.]MDN5317900.1 hypothetical protein [Thermoanaerobacterium sp.]WHE06342.1 hypothetical protein PGH24_09215 [Thermoanaerobacterium thermosaccharolyticum]